MDGPGYCRGDAGDDTMVACGDGYGRLEGGSGADHLAATFAPRLGQSVDMVGGRGADVFEAVGNLDGAFSQSHVLDFTPGQDKLHLWTQNADGAWTTLTAAQVFAALDADGNLVLDGNDPASAVGSTFALGEPEHGIGLLVGDAALVVELAEDVAVLTAGDFSM